jgi:multidrug efflux system membrane fusion protein
LIPRREELLMNVKPFTMWLEFGALLLAPATICRAEEPPVVRVIRPLQRQVTDHEDFAGRTEAATRVEIRARATGYLTKVAFKDGAEVKQGEVLFEIDPRPYQVALDQAVADVNVHEASLRLARTILDRDRALSLKVPGAVSQQQLDQERAAVDEAAARVTAAKATADVCKLTLDFTRVTAPFAGRIGRRLIDVGNLVKADDTALATVISLDPVYTYFDMDETTLLRIRRALNEGKIKRPEDGVTSVFMGLADENGYPHKGTVDFVNSQVNPTTGTITVRGVFANPRPRDGERLLLPGMVARVRLPIGQPHQALLVPETAVASDQGLKYVYMIDGENKVVYRRVRLGALQPDGLREVALGLKPDERVAVGGLARLRPGMTVTPEIVDVPVKEKPDESGEKIP